MLGYLKTIAPWLELIGLAVMGMSVYLHAVDSCGIIGFLIFGTGYAILDWHRHIAGDND